MRKSLREVMLQNHAALCQMAALAGKPMPPLPASLPPEPKKRAARKPTGNAASPRLEGEIQKEIITWLERHPRIALVVRFNSGAMQYTDRNGNNIPVWFNKIHKRGNHGLCVCDTQSLMVCGKMLIVEVKREGWKFNPNSEREVGQKKYIDLFKLHGNLGCFATCIEDVQEELERG